MANDKTEKATPKKKEDARKKGQVARSNDVNGAVVLCAGLLGMSAFGPKVITELKLAMVQALQLTATPGVVDKRGVGTLMVMVGQHVGLAILPIGAVCLLAGFVAAVGQVGFKPTPSAIKPDFKKINPASGLKNIFSLQTLGVESAKNLAKVAIVGSIAAMALFPRLNEVAALVGLPPDALINEAARTIMTIAQRAAIAYLVIAACDYAWQRFRHEKTLRMDHTEIKQEFKQQGTPAEIKSAQRRRAMELSRSRMMDAVPTADVIVTNPTHYSVALKYDSGNLAPVVVAKGADLLAFKIREVAKEHGVMVVPDPPLARTLYANVDLGKQIPEDLFHAVAELLAYVYRVAGATRSLAAR
jgi:flagellar biosynthesis protein FlhB